MTADTFSKVVQIILTDRKAEGGSGNETLRRFLESYSQIFHLGRGARPQRECASRKSDASGDGPTARDEAAAEMVLSVLTALDVPVSAHIKVLRYASEQIAEKSRADSREDRAFAEARRQSRGAERDFFREQGRLLATGTFAQRLGCSVRELENRHARNEFLALERERQIAWPGWQIHRTAPLPGLAEVIIKLTERGFAPTSIASFFVCPSDCLYQSSAHPRRDGVRRSDSPLSLLRRRGMAALDLVLMHAERYREQGAT